jgi:hypothetical protein
VTGLGGLEELFIKVVGRRNQCLDPQYHEPDLQLIYLREKNFFHLYFIVKKRIQLTHIEGVFTKNRWGFIYLSFQCAFFSAKK